MDSKKGILLLLVILGLAPWFLLFHQSMELRDTRLMLRELESLNTAEDVARLTSERDAVEARADRLARELDAAAAATERMDAELARIREAMEQQQNEHTRRIEEISATAQAASVRASAMEAAYRETLEALEQKDSGPSRSSDWFNPDGTRRSALEMEQEPLPGPNGGFPAPRPSAPDSAAADESELQAIPDEPVRSTGGRWRLLEAGPAD